ncbi:MAG: cytochrome c oxidase assembly protein [Thioalkalispiraceae bacterium]|jgi:cytochrome c oxidase assembly protein subunit 11
MSNNDKTESANKKVLGVSGLVVIAMFGFGFALIPLYDVFCDAFGLNGSYQEIEDGTYDSAAETERALNNGVDESRTITMQFLVTDNPALDLEFSSKTKRLTMNPGQIKEVSYYVKNRSNKPMVLQAIPDVTPNLAKKYLAKIECFCFRKQTLQPGEEKEMPLRFVVNSALPESIPVLTMTYRFIDLNYKADLDTGSGYLQMASFAGRE